MQCRSFASDKSLGLTHRTIHDWVPWMACANNRGITEESRETRGISFRFESNRVGYFAAGFTLLSAYGAQAQRCLALLKNDRKSH